MVDLAGLRRLGGLLVNPARPAVVHSEVVFSPRCCCESCPVLGPCVSLKTLASLENLKMGSNVRVTLKKLVRVNVTIHQKHMYCCELTLTHDFTQEGAPILEGSILPG